MNNLGPEIVELYSSGLSVREVIPIIEKRHGIKYPSGTLVGVIGRAGALRSKVEARKIAMARQRKVCELCGNKYPPRNYNQRWCDECTGFNKHYKRVRNHGLPASLYEKMFEEQGGKCKVCQKKFETCTNSRHKKTLFVDHDHETKQVRGLLCPRCNMGLSFLDDSRWHGAAIEYITAAKNDPRPAFVRGSRRSIGSNGKPDAEDPLELSGGGVLEAEFCDDGLYARPGPV